MIHNAIIIALSIASAAALVALAYWSVSLRKQVQIWKETAEEASEAIRRLDKLFDDYRKGCAEAAELTKTLHQREIDALRAKHLGEMEEKQADVERYMEAAKRLKEELDALKGADAGLTWGDKCPVHDCQGTLQLEETENCSCHISAPCGACESARILCSICGYEIGGDA